MSNNLNWQQTTRNQSSLLFQTYKSATQRVMHKELTAGSKNKKILLIAGF